MAKTNSATPSYRDILNSIKKKQFSPVYLLSGDEPYYLDMISGALENNVVNEEDRDFNLEIFYGNDTDIATVVAAAQQYPVMAERKLVMLKEAQSMTQARTQLDKMSPYIMKPCETTVLVIIFKGETIPSTSKIVKAVASSGGVVFKSQQLRDYQLPGPVKDYCNAANIGIDDKAVNLLCEYIGQPLNKLFGEIDKLILSIGERKRITPQDIEDNIGISKDFNNFELTAAIRDRNYSKAMMIVDYFRKNPRMNPTPVTTATLFRFFSNLCIAQFSNDKSDSAIMAALELKNSYALRDYRMAMANYNAGQCVNAIHHIREFDAKSKGINSTHDEYSLLGELMFYIMTDNGNNI